MGKRKSQPQKADEFKRRQMTWNMADDFRPLIDDVSHNSPYVSKIAKVSGSAFKTLINLYGIHNFCFWCFLCLNYLIHCAIFRSTELIFITSDHKNVYHRLIIA